MNEIQNHHGVFSPKILSLITSLARSISEPIHNDTTFEIGLIYKRSRVDSTCSVMTLKKINEKQYKLKSLGFYHPKSKFDIFVEAKFKTSSMKITKGNQKLLISTLSSWDKCLYRRIKTNTEFTIFSALMENNIKSWVFQV